MRIPTLLALALIVLALTGATLGFLFKQNFQNNKISPPTDITVSNISSQTATVSWQSATASLGRVAFGETEGLGTEALDDRDKIVSKNYLSHFITLRDLKEDTTYYFKVESNSTSYPAQAIKFKTSKNLKVNPNVKDFNKPLIGVVLSADLEPIDEAIVTLNINGSSPLSTLITTAGNFILPLVDLKTEDLSSPFLIDHQVSGLLTVTRGSTKSEVKISLPINQALPKIVLGQNSDFSNLASPSAQAISSPTPSANPLDLNGDGKVNTLDLSIVLQSLGKKSTDPGFNKAADLNLDGVVDQADIDLMKKAISQ